MSFHSEIKTQLHDALGRPSGDDATQLNNALRVLAKWRSTLIQNTLLQQQGTVVLDGPLKGLAFLADSTEGCHIPKLLGCYEQPLHPFIEQVVCIGYPVVINIGCAEGYYAVGLARRMPGTRVVACDINPAARATCLALAATNGVADRIVVGERFHPGDFAAYAGQRVLVLCDIEGAERELLDPQIAPALRGMDLIVESHEDSVPGLTRELVSRFQASHHINLVQDNGQRRLDHAPDWFVNLAHLDQLLATWEWRNGPTPWLVMQARPQ